MSAHSITRAVCAVLSVLSVYLQAGCTATKWEAIGEVNPVLHVGGTPELQERFVTFWFPGRREYRYSLPGKSIVLIEDILKKSHHRALLKHDVLGPVDTGQGDAKERMWPHTIQIVCLDPLVGLALDGAGWYSERSPIVYWGDPKRVEDTQEPRVNRTVELDNDLRVGAKSIESLPVYWIVFGADGLELHPARNGSVLTRLHLGDRILVLEAVGNTWTVRWGDE